MRCLKVACGLLIEVGNMGDRRNVSEIESGVRIPKAPGSPKRAQGKDTKMSFPVVSVRKKPQKRCSTLQAEAEK